MNDLAFSTLGCPAWSLEQIVEAAREYGYTAIELRGLRDQMDLPLAEPFIAANRQATRRQLRDSGIAVCCVSSSGVVEKANLDHVKSHSELAYDLGCPVVRIFGGNLDKDLPRPEALARSAGVLRSFGDAAQEAGVQLVLETHDAFSRGEQVADLLELAQHPAVFSLWDLHHPYRQGERPQVTYQHLAPTLRYVHVKDGWQGKYTLMGEGDVPLVEMLELILSGGYTGPLSVEWEKRWHPEIADPEIALPQYARVLREYLDKRQADG